MNVYKIIIGNKSLVVVTNDLEEFLRRNKISGESVTTSRYFSDVVVDGVTQEWEFQEEEELPF